MSAAEEGEPVMNLRQAAQQALEAWFRPHGINYVDFKPYMEALRAALAEPEQEPVANKQMLRWVEHLKRLSDDGQHMSIPGLSSGACWELAIELEQFIKNTAPTPRKPLTDEEMRECAQAMNAEPLAEGWPELIKFARAIERAHGIGGGE